MPKNLFTPHVSCTTEFDAHLFFEKSSKRLVGYSAVGRLPARSVSEEKLELVRKEENEKIDLFLNKYKAFCGKVCYALQMFYNMFVFNSPVFSVLPSSFVY